MNTPPAATDPIPLPLAAQLAGIPARTLRNWVKAGKLAAIRGHRGWLVRMQDIEQIAAMIGNDAAGRELAGGHAAGMADTVAASLQGDEAIAANAATTRPTAASLAADRQQQAEALVQQILAPFIAELGTVREELGRARAQSEAKDETIAALQHRLGATEAEVKRARADSTSRMVLVEDLRGRIRTLEAQAAQDKPEPSRRTPEASAAEKAAGAGLWGRVRRWWRGEAREVG